MLPKVVFGTLEELCSSSSALVLPLDVTTPCDSYTSNNRELATLLTLSVSLIMQVTRKTDPRIFSPRLYPRFILGFQQYDFRDSFTCETLLRKGQVKTYVYQDGFLFRLKYM